MIHRTATLLHQNDWKSQLRYAITDPKQLSELLKLTNKQQKGLIEAHKSFPLKIPHAVLDRIEKGNINDPVLLQYMPQVKEITQSAGFSNDPVGDIAASPCNGLLHKYSSRALIIASQVCAVHCRYCFRRHFPYSEMQLSKDHSRNIINYLQQHVEINEIILSGGDPLSLDDNKLEQLIYSLESVKHIRTLRIHTRLPIVIPDRITSKLLSLLDATRFKTVIVIHSNHANELDDNVCKSMQTLSQHCDALLNQSVLLQSVNSNTEALIQLSQRLFECNVMPYYLHLLDKVQGASHFDTDETDAKQLLSEIRKQLPGYLVPQLVKELSGEASKTPVL